MLAHAKLFISLSRGPIQPKWGHNYLNEFRGGPETLLAWLETQLGLPFANTPQASRISEYTAALDTLSDSSINKSLDADRWSTASANCSPLLSQSYLQNAKTIKQSPFDKDLTSQMSDPNC